MESNFRRGEKHKFVDYVKMHYHYTTLFHKMHILLEFITAEKHLINVG